MESFLRNEIGGKNMKKLFAMLMVGAMALTATGCGSNDGSSKGGSTAQNTLTVGATDLKGQFSPIYYETAYDGYAIDLIYQSLLNYDVESNLVPQIAAEMPTVSKDGKKITFKLKDGLKFSDGSTLDANDVKFTFTVVADPSYDSRFGSTSENIVGYDEYHNKENTSATELTGIKVIDPLTVEFNLKTARVDALADIGTTFGIISDEQFKDYKRGDTKMFKDNLENPIGSGPYKLNKWDKASGASFVFNENYPAEEGKYQVKNIIIKPVETSTEYNELEKGTVDLLPTAIESSKIGPASLNENLTYNSYPRAGMGYISYNTTQGPTADKAVRQALTYAFDRQSFVDSYYSFEKASDEVKKAKLGYVPTAFLNPASPLGNIVRGETKLNGLETYKYDIEKAKSILDEAGWTVGADGIREKDGQKLTIKLMSATEVADLMNSLVPVWQDGWAKQLGVDLKQTTVDFNTLTEKVTDDEALGEWNVFFMAVGFTGVSLTEINNTFLSTASGRDGNYARVNDPSIDKYLNAGLNTADEKVAEDNYKKAIIAANEYCAYVPVYGNTYFDLYNKRVKGLKTGPVYTWADAMADVTLE